MPSGEPDLESLTVAFFEGMPGAYIICKGIQEICIRATSRGKFYYCTPLLLIPWVRPGYPC